MNKKIHWLLFVVILFSGCQTVSKNTNEVDVRLEKIVFEEPVELIEEETTYHPSLVEENSGDLINSVETVGTTNKISFHERLLLERLLTLALIHPYQKEIVDQKITVIEIEDQIPFDVFDFVVIDPGHGGKDPGAASGHVHEKDIVLNVALFLKTLFEEEGIRAELTRNRDQFISLDDRVSFVNDLQPDLFLSLHVNASEYLEAAGVEAYIFSEGAAHKRVHETMNEEFFPQESFSEDDDFERESFKYLSEDLAGEIIHSISRNLRIRNRGVKEASFYVLKYVTVPRILLEMGYLSNENEKKNLTSLEYQKKLSQSIFEGVMTYVERR